MTSVISEKEGDNLIDYFVNMPEVKEVTGKGSAKAFVKLNNGIDADLLVVPKESFWAALQYFTGSKEHGVADAKEIYLQRSSICCGVPSAPINDGVRRHVPLIEGLI